MAKSLVTGAAGFIGRRLVESLLTAGDEVVCLDRFSSHRPDVFDGTPVEVVRGDVRDPATADRIMCNVDRVFHLASAVATRSLKESRSINVDGTRNLARAAAARITPPVFLYVSSLAAAGPNSSPATEDGPCAPVSRYGQTKLEAERALQELSDRLPVTVVRPPCVFGPGDRNLLTLYNIIKRGWNLVVFKEFSYSYLSVADLVPGVMRAAAVGKRLPPGPNPRRTGYYYLTDPESVTFLQLAEKIAVTLGRTRVRHIHVPAILAWAVGAAGEASLRLAGRRAFLNLDKIREGVSGSWLCDGTRARQELSFAPAVDLLTRLLETKNFYAELGWL